jgi:hypothetical protein
MRPYFAVLSLLTLLCASSCGDDDSGSGSIEQTGQACQAPAQCYPGIDQTQLKGAVVCLDDVPGGYCTHVCSSDQDCCAVPGECRSGFPQVCSPFQANGQKYCFLSCEADVVSSAGFADDAQFCQQSANAAFGCRSSGGGVENRKVCVP